MLNEQGILSDARFARSYLEMRVEKGFGPLKIRAELRARGIKREIIDELFDLIEVDWLHLVEQVRVKKFGKEKPSQWNDKIKQSRFLQSRGFNESEIMTVIGDLD